MTVYEQIRRAYLLSGLTQAQIAVRAGVHENTVGRIVSQPPKNTNADSLIAVAQVLSIPSLDLETRSYR